MFAHGNNDLRYGHCKLTTQEKEVIWKTWEREAST